MACPRSGKTGRPTFVVVLCLAGLVGAAWLSVPARADEIRPAWMKVDAEVRTVRLTMVGSADGTNGTMNFNGYGQGEMTVVVPLGWKVHVDFENKGLGALPHSLVVIDPVTPLPIEGGVPAFPRALTIKLVPGMLAGETDSFDFVANREGRFLWFCGVTGHGVAGMWDYLVVSRDVKAPGVQVTGKK